MAEAEDALEYCSSGSMRQIESQQRFGCFRSGVMMIHSGVSREENVAVSDEFKGLNKKIRCGPPKNAKIGKITRQQCFRADFSTEQVLNKVHYRNKKFPTLYSTC